MNTEETKPPFYVTIGFRCVDSDAFTPFWKLIREQYQFCEGGPDIPVQAFAVSMGNMFEEQDVVDAILGSDLGPAEKEEAIGEVPCCQDLRALCAEWGFKHPYETTEADIPA